ncbi:TcpQ domain-containing protein [Paucibacter soli]|uniref:TcpQ domain-containing protein n=1 Tax=Paucibacter soli TaxID=3133433 RepID=UPI0030A179F8
MHSPLRIIIAFAVAATAMAGASAEPITIIAPAPLAAASGVSSQPSAVPDVVGAQAAPKSVPWSIERGERIDLALQRWAATAGWSLNWVPLVSWECPARVEFNGDFTSVAIQVIEALNQDGKRLRLRIFDSGRYMEVVSDAAN